MGGKDNPVGSRINEGDLLNSKVRQLLREFQRSLGRALAESPEIGRVLERIRREGWSLYLVVDRDSDEEPEEAVELTPTKALSAGEPVFRIDGKDLVFLKSVGIDPTRKLKRRRDP